MAKITLQGNPLNTIGELPQIGTQAPNFKLVAADLSEKTLDDYRGKKVVLNIFPSLDTGTCAASVRRFNAEAVKMENTIVLCISKDLPFAQARFCGAEGLDKEETLSDFRYNTFCKDYGVGMAEGPLAALMSRAVVVLDEQGKVSYTEQVADIVDEPNYEKAIDSLK